MKRYIMVVLILIALMSQTLTVGAQEGQTVTCDNGAGFENGIKVTISQLRADYEYTATAVGIDGFDPVLAVLGEDGTGLCNDDAQQAAVYSADLPTTGYVAPSNLSAQVTFAHSDPSGFADISLVVGGYGNQSGRFLLILEGMAVTAEDNSGDPFLVELTPAMVADGTLSVYMMTRGQSSVDPVVYLADMNGGVQATEDGVQMACDDAGTSSCFGASSRALDNYGVTIATGELPGWAYDAYMSFDISGVPLGDDPALNTLPFMMTSYEGSEGQYLVVFEMGIAN